MIIYITSGCEDTIIARRFRSALPHADVRLLPDNENTRQQLFTAESCTGKRNILITRAKGEHFKVCPGTPEPYLCCYYWTLHSATNCPYDCTYCILQYYLNNPLLTFFSNQNELMDQIRYRIRQEPQRLFRVGTGELTDSLALDDIALIGPDLISFAARQPNMILELKTKSDKVDHLLNIPHYGRTVISWSLNPPDRMAGHEHEATDLSARMRAVRKVQEAGYMTGFHFDPMLAYCDWKDGYENLVKTLFMHADPRNIAWISIGSLRFPPEMADNIRVKFPATDLLDGEMIRGRDNKMRYFKPLRIMMYKHLYACLRKYGGEDLFIYFCMEDADVWKRVVGSSPDSNEHLDYLFAEQITKKFPALQLPAPSRQAYCRFNTRRSWE